MKRIAIRSIVIWCLIVPLAIMNGVLRDLVLAPRLGHAALPLSGVLLSLLIIGLTWLCLPWIGAQGIAHQRAIGAGWLALTLIFEFGFGRFIAGKSWVELFAAYDLSSGNLWLLVLGTTACAPWLAARYRGLHATR